MATRNVRFVATRTVTKPTRVKFKTKSGKTVSFRALKTVKVKKVKVKESVRFDARKK